MIYKLMKCLFIYKMANQDFFDYRGRVLTVDNIGADSGHFKVVFTNEDDVDEYGEPSSNLFAEIINVETGARMKIDRWGLRMISVFLDDIEFGHWNHFPITLEEVRAARGYNHGNAQGNAQGGNQMQLN